MAHFECLYYFSSSDLNVIEIKRLDQPDHAPLSDIYKWFIVSLKTKKVFELDFKSMRQDAQRGERIFEEGILEFDDGSGKLHLLGQDILLSRYNKDEIPATTLKLIKNYLTTHFQNNELYSFRNLKPSDVAYFKDWIFDKEVIRYSMTKYHRISTELEVVKWFHSTLFDSNSFNLGMVDSVSKKLIGYAGIAALNEIDGNGEYFIFIGNKSYWGKGIASSVTKEILKLGFEKLNLHRIFLTASSRNPGAIRAYEKAGFIHEGRMREAFYRNGEYSDKIIMGILKKEYAK